MMQYVWIIVIALIVAALMLLAYNRVDFVKKALGPKA